MSTKRVHELQRELRERGLPLSNVELVKRLHALGYPVKSHSSTLSDAEASTALQLILAKKPAPNDVPVRGGLNGRARLPPTPLATGASSAGSEPVFQRTRRTRPTGRQFILDVSNICRDGRQVDLKKLDAAIEAVRGREKDAELRLVADANVEYLLKSAGDEAQLTDYRRRLATKEIEQVPGGMKADEFILALLHKHPNAQVVTNDGFRSERDRGETPADLERRQWRFNWDRDGECMLRAPRPREPTPPKTSA